MMVAAISGANHAVHRGSVAEPTYKPGIGQDVFQWLTSIEHYHVPRVIVHQILRHIRIESDETPRDQRLAFATMQAENFNYNVSDAQRFHWFAVSHDAETFWRHVHTTFDKLNVPITDRVPRVRAALGIKTTVFEFTGTFATAMQMFDRSVEAALWAAQPDTITTALVLAPQRSLTAVQPAARPSWKKRNLRMSAQAGVLILPGSTEPMITPPPIVTTSYSYNSPRLADVHPQLRHALYPLMDELFDQAVSFLLGNTTSMELIHSSERFTRRVQSSVRVDRSVRPRVPLDGPIPAPTVNPFASLKAPTQTIDDLRARQLEQSQRAEREGIELLARLLKEWFDIEAMPQSRFYEAGEFRYSLRIFVNKPGITVERISPRPGLFRRPEWIKSLPIFSRKDADQQLKVLQKQYDKLKESNTLPSDRLKNIH